MVKAITMLAQEIGAETKGYVTDYYGNRKTVDIALYPRDLPRGIGFTISNNRLVIHGDPYRYKTEFTRYSELAKNYINSYKAIKTTIKLYPHARIKSRIRDRVVEVEVEI